MSSEFPVTRLLQSFPTPSLVAKIVEGTSLKNFSSLYRVHEESPQGSGPNRKLIFNDIKSRHRILRIIL
jgi:hypothetical protein